MVEHRNAQVADGFYARLCACLTRSLPGAASSASPSRNSSRSACTQEPHPGHRSPQRRCSTTNRRLSDANVRRKRPLQPLSSSSVGGSNIFDHARRSTRLYAGFERLFSGFE
jgi:hypothetical protein